MAWLKLYFRIHRKRQKWRQGKPLSAHRGLVPKGVDIIIYIPNCNMGRMVSAGWRARLQS